MSAKLEVENLARLVAEKVKWKNFKVSGDVDFEKGNGFLGEFLLLAVKNTDTNETLDVAIKKAFKNKERREEINIAVAFKNEIYFYDKIIPTLLKFQEPKGTDISFDFVPKFYACIEEKPNECLIMENLKTLGYDIIDRQNLLTNDQIKVIFKTYGQFHGLSFAYKDQHTKEYQDLLSPVTDFFSTLRNKTNYNKALKSGIVEAFEYVNDNIRNNCSKYFAENCMDIFWESTNYKGKHSGLMHGDCWSSNMMFKYKDIKVEAMKLIDFQLIKDSTPVHDLSYFLYAGAHRREFSKLDKYLVQYHNSFSKTVRALGSDPEKLLPLEVLKQDWKEYSKFGIMMGLVLGKMKMVGNDDVQDMTNDSDFLEQFTNIKVDESLKSVYQQRVRDVIEDTYAKGFLQ